MQHENIPGILEEIQQRIAAMRDSMRVEEKAARLKELEAKMGEPGFWDNQDVANEIISELKSIKARIDPVQEVCLLYTSPSPRDQRGSRMPSSA